MPIKVYIYRGIATFLSSICNIHCGIVQDRSRQYRNLRCLIICISLSLHSTSPVRGSVYSSTDRLLSMVTPTLSHTMLKISLHLIPHSVFPVVFSFPPLYIALLLTNISVTCGSTMVLCLLLLLLSVLVADSFSGGLVPLLPNRRSQVPSPFFYWVACWWQPVV